MPSSPLPPCAVTLTPAQTRSQSPGAAGELLDMAPAHSGGGPACRTAPSLAAPGSRVLRPLVLDLSASVRGSWKPGTAEGDSAQSATG
ncbi:hypothetical protein NDU88_008923 [Pleurodeles waltl]|uniref:Uncharacterized protein n=1 Tax=Pleurodeles waltl TaxID=8319 RepID=A0AAV7QU95_PLEWA|nr:hypothetical protein NDU88_008923 [Pleurodeles waltl]